MARKEMALRTDQNGPIDMNKHVKHWPADKVERKSIDELIPYVSNSRTHSDEQIDQIAASMKEWGWTNPVLIDESGMIIAGHGRVLAAKKLGFDDVPVMIAEDWSEAKKRAYVIADNKLALNADWDYEILMNELAQLEEDEFDISMIGFGGKELADLLNYEDSTNANGDDTEQSLGEFFKIEVDCKDASEQEEVFNKLSELGYTCKVLTL